MKFRKITNHAFLACLFLGMTGVSFADDSEDSKSSESESNSEYAAKLSESSSKSDSEKEKEIEKEKEKEKEDSKNSVNQRYDLDVSKSIMVGGTDEASKIFMEKALEKFYEVAGQKEAKDRVSGDFTAGYLDAKGLTLKEDCLLRAYFVGESTSYKNLLGFTVDNSSDLTTIFDNASTLANLNGEGSSKRTDKSPLQPGDYVDLGKFAAGSNLDFHFFEYSNDKLKGFFSTESGLNSDGIVHAMSLSSEGSSYLLIGFEDGKKGGDRDFNEMVFALEFSHSEHGGSGGGVVSTPEPSLAIGSLFSAGVLAFQRRRRA